MANDNKDKEETDRITFGKKHKGELVSNVIKTDASYIKWAVEKGLIKLPKYLKL